jgi:hypothetical protein
VIVLLGRVRRWSGGYVTHACISAYAGDRRPDPEAKAHTGGLMAQPVYCNSLVGCFGGSTINKLLGLFCTINFRMAGSTGREIFCRVPACSQQQPDYGMRQLALCANDSQVLLIVVSGGFDVPWLAWSLTRRRRGSILACALQL